MTWNGPDHRTHNDPKRNRGRRMTDKNGIHLKSWMIPILISLILGLVTYSATGGSVNQRIVHVETQNIEDKQVNTLFYQQQGVIIGLVNTVDRLDKTQTIFNEKYDKNREADQAVFRQILAAVKS